MRTSKLVRAQQAPDTPELIAQRKLERACLKQAQADRLVKFPVIRADNAQEATDYLERRYQDLLEHAKRRAAK